MLFPFLDRLRAAVLLAIIPLLLVALLASGARAAGIHPGKEPPTRAEVIMVGDRLVDVAYHLGVVPRAMSIRGDVWPFGRTLANTTSMILGCPHYIVKKDPDIIPRTLRETGITLILIERTPGFDLHKPFRNPMNVVPVLEQSGVLEDLGVTVEIVDFGAGVDAAIRRVGALLDRTDEAEALIATRAAAMAAVTADLPLMTDAGASVVVLEGVHQDATGKGFVRVDLPGGHTDASVLAPLGLTNAGGTFVEAGAKARHGFAAVRSLAPLKTAGPDVIVLTGDTDAAQRLLMMALKADPTLATEVPALATGAVVALPTCTGSHVVEHPAILKRWAVTLEAALAAR